MRKLILIPALCVLASVAVLMAQTKAPAAAPMSGKVDVQWKCPAANPMNALPVGDKPDHNYIIQQFKCTASHGEVAGVKNKDGAGTEFVEATGNSGKGHGVFVETLANGDKITYSYTSTGVTANGKLTTGSDKWMATSGTGKFKGITSSGTCTAKGAPDGSVTFDCMGTYTIGK